MFIVHALHCEKGKGTHCPAQRAGDFCSRCTGLLMAVRKNGPLVLRQNIAGS